MVAVVAIEEHDDVGWVDGEVCEGFQTGSAVAALGLVDDFGAVLPGDLGCCIRGAVVGDDDAADWGLGDLAEDQRERLLLIEGRDDDGDVLHGLWR
jgi:hypothetical protein